jgi:hypothetical protein
MSFDHLLRNPLSTEFYRSRIVGRKRSQNEKGHERRAARGWKL